MNELEDVKCFLRGQSNVKNQIKQELFYGLFRGQFVTTNTNSQEENGHTLKRKI